MITAPKHEVVSVRLADGDVLVDWGLGRLMGCRLGRLSIKLPSFHELLFP